MAINSARRWAGWCALYLTFALLLTFRAWTSPQQSWVGGLPDPPVSIWFIHWMPFALSHGMNPLYTHFLNYPSGINSMWVMPMPLPSLVLSPITAIFGAIVTYNLICTLAIAFSCAAFHVAAGRWVRSNIALVGGALLYGVSPYMDIHIHVHAMLAFIPFPPLLLMLIHDGWTGVKSPRRVGLLMGLILAAQYLIAQELAAMEVVVVAVAIAVLLAVRAPAAPKLWRRMLKAAAWVVPFPLIFAAGPAMFQLFGPGRVTGVLQPDNVFVNDLFSFVVPTSVQVVAPPQAADFASQFSGGLGEWSGYVGIVVLLVSIAVAWRLRREPVVRYLAALAAVMAVLSLGATLHIGGRDTAVVMPWWLFDHLPVLKLMLPSRFGLFVFLPLCFLVAIGLDRLVLAHRGKLAAILAAGCFISVMPEMPLVATSFSVPTFFTTQQLRTTHGVLVAPFPRAQNPDAMLWQEQSGFSFPMAGGYDTQSSQCDVCQNQIVNGLVAIEVRGMLPPLPTAGAAAELVASDVRTVVVGPMAHESVAVAYCTRLFGEPTYSGAGVTVWQLRAS